MPGIVLGTGDINKNIKLFPCLKKSLSSERDGLVNKQLQNNDSWEYTCEDRMLWDHNRGITNSHSEKKRNHGRLPEASCTFNEVRTN